MQIFQNYDSNTFKYNGNRFVKNFLCLTAGDEAVAVYNAFDTRMQLMPPTHFSNVKIDGASFPSQSVLMDILSPMIFAKQVVSEGSFKDEIISMPAIERSGNTLTIPTGGVWRLGGIVHSNDSDFTRTIPFASSGSSRIDIIVANAAGTFILLSGIESEDVANAPTVPVNTLLVTSINVIGDTISITNPFTGDEFIRKIEVDELSLFLTFPVPNFNLAAFVGALRMIGTCELLASFNFYNSEQGNLYNGKRFIIKNFQENPITLKHLAGINTFKMYFPNEEDYILEPNHIAEFSLSKLTNRLEFIGQISDAAADNPDLQTVLDINNVAVDQSIKLESEDSSHTIDSISNTISTINGIDGGSISVGNTNTILDESAIAALGIDIGGAGANARGYLTLSDYLQRAIEVHSDSIAFNQNLGGGTTIVGFRADNMLENEYPVFQLPALPTGEYPFVTSINGQNADVNGDIYFQPTLNDVVTNGNMIFNQGILLRNPGHYNSINPDSIIIYGQTVGEEIPTDLPTILLNKDGVTSYLENQSTTIDYLQGLVLRNGGTGKTLIRNYNNITDNELVVPTFTGLRTIPISVNGQSADLNGNITISGGSSIDTFITGGTYSVANKILTLNKNTGSPVTITGVSEVSQTILSGNTTTAPSEAVVSTALELLAPKNNPTFTGNVALATINNSTSSSTGQITLGTGSAPVTVTRNTNTSAPVFRARNLSSTSTGNIIEVDRNIAGVQTVVAGFDYLGHGFGPNAISLNHFVTLGQIPFKIKNATPTSVYTGTVQQIIYSHLIPANTFKVGTVFQVKCWIDRGAASSVGNLGTNFYIGSTASSLVFNNICASHTRAASAGYLPTIRTFTVEAGGIRCIQWNLNTSSDELIQVAASNIRPFDYTQDQYFIVAGTNTNAADIYQGTIFTLNADL